MCHLVCLAFRSEERALQHDLDDRALGKSLGPIQFVDHDLDQTEPDYAVSDPAVAAAYPG